MFINLLKNHLNRFKLISFLSLPSIKNCLGNLYEKIYRLSV